MNCSRPKIITTLICLFVFCGYLFLEFHSRRLVAVETTLATNRSTDYNLLRHQLGVGNENMIDQGIADPANAASAHLRNRAGEGDKPDYVENTVDEPNPADVGRTEVENRLPDHIFTSSRVDEPSDRAVEAEEDAQRAADFETEENQVDNAGKNAISAGQNVENAEKDGGKAVDAQEALRQVQAKQKEIQERLDSQRASEVSSRCDWILFAYD